MIVTILPILFLFLTCEALTSNDVWMNEISPGFLEVAYKSTVSISSINALGLYLVSSTGDTTIALGYLGGSQTSTLDGSIKLLTFFSALQAVNAAAIMEGNVPINFYSFDGQRTYNGVPSIYKPLPTTYDPATLSLRATGSGCKLSDFTLSWIDTSLRTPGAVNNGQFISCAGSGGGALTSNDVWMNEISPGFLEVAYKSTVSISSINALGLYLVSSTGDTTIALGSLGGSLTSTLDGSIKFLTFFSALQVVNAAAIMEGNVPINFYSFDGQRTYNGVPSIYKPLPTTYDPATLSLRATGSGCKLSDFTLSWIDTSLRTPGAVNNGQFISCAGSGGGDPHFRTFDGTKYSFHGQCDLVLTRTDSMGSLGLPLIVHARATIQSWYSYISQAVVQIGSDTFEITANGQHYLNGLMDVELPQSMAGQYQITTKEKTTIKANKPTILSAGNLTRTVYKIQLDGQDHIEISRFKEMLYVKVNVALPNSEGMLGKQGTVGLIGRDGVTVMKDSNAMGLEWQVRDDEPQLFVDDMNRAPQYPEQCTLPSVTRRRMLRSNGDYERAKIVCNDIEDPDLKEFCIEDILITGDFDLVNSYSY